MARRSLALGLLLPFVLAACTGGQYLRGYKTRSAEDERTMLAPIAPDLAETIYASKTAMKANPRDTAAVHQLAKAYDDLSLRQKGKSADLSDYGAAASLYELRVYKARGGPMTPIILAEVGRNLALGRDPCKGRAYIAKAVEMDPAVEEAYREAIVYARDQCQARDPTGDEKRKRSSMGQY